MYQIITCEDHTLHVKIKHFHPAHTFLCGQCFRWNQDENGLWTGIVSGQKLQLQWNGETCTFLNMDKNTFMAKWALYFDLNTNYANIKRILQNKDSILKKAVAYGHGIHLLRQDFWEVLLSFLISQNNGIPRIKQIIESLSMDFGLPINETQWGFPEISALADASLEEINRCRGGYRCRYISQVAKKLIPPSSLINNVQTLSREEAREALLSLPGIGEKVADCILLYSGIDRRAFPIDRWVKRVMETLYFKKETDIKSIRAFAREYFGDLAGIAQQYLFYYARAEKIGL